MDKNMMLGDSFAQDIELSSSKEAVIKAIVVYKTIYSMQSPNSGFGCQTLKTTIGLTKEKTLEFKTKRPEESSLNWRPLHNNWAATTSKPKEVQDYT
ncbi:hypothetical protein Tco_0781411 [Tanacetum coccineum]